MKRCTKCLNERPEADYTKWSKNWCRACRNAYSRAYMKKTHRLNARRAHLRSTFSLSLIQWDAILAAQGGKCLICQEDAKTGLMCVDHDHESGNIRGLLCRKCNSGLGLFKDNPYTLYRAFKHLEYKLPKSPRQPETVEDVLRPTVRTVEAEDKEPPR